jgi:hypothetical protein
MSSCEHNLIDIKIICKELNIKISHLFNLRGKVLTTNIYNPVTHKICEQLCFDNL